MGESKLVIDIKKRRLKEELAKENPKKEVIKKLQEDIKRHIQWEKKRMKAKWNRKKNLV